MAASLPTCLNSLASFGGYYSSRRMASLVAFLVALQSPTLASTYQRSNSYRPDSSWRDYSSDRDVYQLYPFESQSPLYYSENEEEEQIVSNLAKVESDDNSESTYSSSDTSRRRRKHRKRKRRRRKRPQQIKGEEAASEELSSGSGESVQSDEALRTRSSAVNLQSVLKEPSDAIQLEPSAQHIPLPSRLGELEGKLQEEASNEYSSNTDAEVRPWGTGKSYPNAYTMPPPRPTAFATVGSRLNPQPTYPRYSNPSSTSTYSSSDTLTYPPSSQVRSHSTHPSNPPRSPQTPASRLPARSHPSPPTSIRQQTMPTRPKPKQRSPANPPSAASKKTTTLTSAKDKSVSPWVRKFHSTRPKDCLVLVPRDYILDNFNLARLAPIVEHLATQKKQELEASSPNLEENGKSALARMQQQQPTNNQVPPRQTYPIYRQALELILRQSGDNPKEQPSQIVQYAAEVLYTLIHARYVVSPRGLDTIRSRLIVHGSKSINQPLFGRCPRLGCGGMPLLPCGLSDDFDSNSASHHVGNSKAKRYCCNCRETFHCWESKVDGSAWGTSAPHLLLMVYGKQDLFPSHFATPYKTPPNEKLGGFATPGSHGRIFGYPIHPAAKLS